MMPRPTLPPEILEGRVIAIARGLSPAAVLAAAAGLSDAGIRALEVTMDSPDALFAIRELVASHGQWLSVGAGTVRSVADAQAATAAGADYLVAPNFDPDVVAWAVTHGVAALPGALTPTEVLAAWEAGAAAVKVFPAGPLGVGYLRALAEPLRDVPLIPTGGINEGNAAAFLEAGAVAVGVGGGLLGDGEPSGVRDRARALRSAITDRTEPA